MLLTNYSQTFTTILQIKIKDTTMKKINSIGISLALASILGLGLTGCGSSSSSSPTSDTVSTGTFVDAPVKGLYYSTPTQSGYTNASGEYKYIDGETVEFKLGDLSLGTTTAGKLITPYTMAGTDLNNSNSTSTNIATLLQNFDGNRTNSDMIDVTKLKDYKFSDIDIHKSTAEMESKLTTKLATGSFQSYVDEKNNNLITAGEAEGNMKKYVEIAQNYIGEGIASAGEMSNNSTGMNAL